MNRKQYSLIAFRSNGTFDMFDRSSIINFAAAVCTEDILGKPQTAKLKADERDVLTFIDAVVNAEKFRHMWRVQNKPEAEKMMEIEKDVAMAIAKKYGF